ncbi:MAG: phage integrase SAM-like domain-containing protein, partial [Saprospiraceae bacterium]
MASLAKIQRLDKKNKKGEAPIYFRIIKNRKVRYIASGIRLEEKHWNKNKELVRSNHKNHKRLNSYLSHKFTELQDKIFQHETISKSLNTAMLKEHIMGKAPEDFMEYAKKDLEIQWKAGKIGEHNKRKYILNKLIRYLDGRKLYFQNLDVKFLKEYENHLRHKLGNGVNTVTKDLKYFRTLFNNAIREDLIEPGLTPFLKYKMKSEKTHREYLTEEELQRIVEFKTIPYSKLDLHRDMFVFAANVGGFRISDVLLLEYTSIENIHLHIKIRKTGSQLSIQIPQVAISIIDKWRSAPNKSNRFVFPILPDDIDLKGNSSEQIKYVEKLLSSATTKVNKNLKTVAKGAKIKKNVSTHIARHTWATRALRKGISLDK